jgi:hypothetical protein
MKNLGKTFLNSKTRKKKLEKVETHFEQIFLNILKILKA